MHAKVRLLRHNGARLEPTSGLQWHEGILETESPTVRNRTIRRLVLRDYQSAPGMGVIAALHQP